MIGIIDSGIGGKGIKKEIKKIIPGEKIFYIADRKNFPYGTKKTQVLNKIIAFNINKLIRRRAKIIVLACNSGSVTSLKYLRKRFSLPIVGVVPAIKTAAKISKTKKIAIFATPITTRSGTQAELIRKYCQGYQVYKISMEDLASQIEFNQLKKAEENIRKKWQLYRNKRIDVIVLGCTHYTLVKSLIRKIVGKKIRIVDSNVAVARQVKRLYDKVEE
mgnify:CR=1 FL=1